FWSEGGGPEREILDYCHPIDSECRRGQSDHPRTRHYGESNSFYNWGGDGTGELRLHLRVSNWGEPDGRGPAGEPGTTGLASEPGAETTAAGCPRSGDEDREYPVRRCLHYTQS